MTEKCSPETDCYINRHDEIVHCPLHAAAPTLLTALENLYRAEITATRCHECYVCSEHEDGLEQALVAVPTAIAQAKGEA